MDRQHQIRLTHTERLLNDRKLTPVPPHVLLCFLVSTSPRPLRLAHPLVWLHTWFRAWSRWRRSQSVSTQLEFLKGKLFFYYILYILLLLYIFLHIKQIVRCKDLFSHSQIYANVIACCMYSDHQKWPLASYKKKSHKSLKHAHIGSFSLILLFFTNKLTISIYSFKPSFILRKYL